MSEENQQTAQTSVWLSKRFQGYLPVVIDVETGGVNADTDALLEIAAVFLKYDDGELTLGEHFQTHVNAFAGGKISKDALAINKIDPDHPFRFAVDEKVALTELFKLVNEQLKQTKCRRAILVGHNAHFDLGFLNAAAKRCDLFKESPFHSFSVFDTCTLGGMFYGKTVLARAIKAAGISFDKDEAHSALYDAQKTAELFCKMANKMTDIPK